MNDKTISVLLIEDNPGDARLVREVLAEMETSLPTRLTHTERLYDGLKQLELQPVDAILLDLSLPDSSGLATFYRLYSQVRQVPIIVLTGMDDDGIAQTVMRAGAQDYLVKGQVDGRILTRSIRYAIERKISEDNLRASEERYRALVEQASDGIFIADQQGNFLDVNSSGCAMLGYSREDLLSKNMRELVLPGTQVQPGFWTHEDLSGRVVIQEYELLCKDGSYLPVEVSAKLLADGRRQGIVRDISARKQADIALLESNEFNRMLVKALPFRMEIVDEQGRILYIDPDMEAALGGNVTGEHCWNIHRDDRTECSDCPLKHPIEIGQTKILQTGGLKDDRIFEITHTGMWYQGRKAILEVFQDITERKQMEEKLQSTAQLLKFHVENSPLAWIEFDNQHRIVHWSDRAQEIFGWTFDEVRGKLVGEVNWVYAEDLQVVDDQIEIMLGTHQTSNVLVNRNYRKDGSVITCEWYSSAMFDPDGKLISVQSLVLDITERRQAELALRESEAFGQAILYNSPIGISVRDKQGRLLTANQAWQNIWAVTEAEMLQAANDVSSKLEFDGRTDSSNDYRQDVHAVYDQGGTLHLPELKVPAPRPGAAHWVSQHFYAVVDEHGLVDKVVILTEDITERKDAELSLVRAHTDMEQRVIDRTFELKVANLELEKAARMKDEFLASMSHELRTPLTGILGLSEALQMVTYGDLNEKQLKALKNIETSGRHLLSLINDILDLSKIEAGMFNMQFSPASLDGICQASLQMIKGMAGQKHQNISIAMDPATIILRVDARRLKQMLVNLLGNAVKFTPDGGQVGIEVKGLPGSRQVDICVWDTGIGIKEEDLPRLFKPFVQLDSKLSRQYSGTGLGLSLVKRMAELQGGQIRVESVFGSGSRFTLSLPWVVDDTQPLKYARRVTDKLQRALTFDQNEESAARLSALLKLVGLKNQVLVTATNALEQVTHFWPDVIFIGEHLPEGAGLNLLQSLKADLRTNAIPVVLIIRPDQKQNVERLGANGALMEPFAQSELHIELQRIAFNAESERPLLVAGRLGSGRVPEPVQELEHGPLVLVVDDNQIILDLISDFLRGQGFRVSAVNSGQALLGRLEVIRPDILLVDVQMPGMSGFDLIRAIRAHVSEWVAQLPVIALTSMTMSGDRERCLDAGANQYLTKPLQLQELLIYVQALTRAQGASAGD